MFCPTCGNLLLVEESTDSLRFSCNTCPYICKIRRTISSRIYPTLKVSNAIQWAERNKKGIYAINEYVKLADREPHATPECSVRGNG